MEPRALCVPDRSSTPSYTPGLLQGEGECSARGPWVQMMSYALEAAVAAQDVAPGLTDQHAVHCQHVQPHLQQDVLQPTSYTETETGFL